MTEIVVFFAWTWCLYVTHRSVHVIPMLREIHWDHHRYVNTHSTGWHWNNLLLFNDTGTSTVDLWITEVIPTVIFSYVTGEWWVLWFYYVWAALLQETLEHNSKVNVYPWLTSGKWHLVHHKNMRNNYGVFTPLWDMIFRTHNFKDQQ